MSFNCSRGNSCDDCSAERCALPDAIHPSDGFTNAVIEQVRGARLAAAPTTCGAARVGIGRRGRRAPRARAARFVVVVFTPRCLKLSSRASFRFGLECRARCNTSAPSFRVARQKQKERRTKRGESCGWVGPAGRGKRKARGAESDRRPVLDRVHGGRVFPSPRHGEPSAWRSKSRIDGECARHIRASRHVTGRGRRPQTATKGSDRRPEWSARRVCERAASAERRARGADVKRRSSRSANGSVHAEPTARGSWDRGMHADR